MKSFVEFRDVCKYYTMGEHTIAAADHINFSIEQGEFTVIVGPSGAGKTTVLNMLGGMDTCDEVKNLASRSVSLKRRSSTCPQRISGWMLFWGSWTI